MSDITPKECAFALMTFSDTDFAECSVYASKMLSAGINGPGGYTFPEDMVLTKSDLESFSHTFMDWLKASQIDIISGEDNNTSA